MMGPLPQSDPPAPPPNLKAMARRLIQIDGHPSDGTYDEAPGDAIQVAAQELSAMIDDNNIPWAMLPDHIKAMRFVQAERVIAVYFAKVVPEKTLDGDVAIEVASLRTTVMSLQQKVERQTPTMMLREINRLKGEVQRVSGEVVGEYLKQIGWVSFFHDLLTTAGVDTGAALKAFVQDSVARLRSTPEPAADQTPLPPPLAELEP